MDSSVVEVVDADAIAIAKSYRKAREKLIDSVLFIVECGELLLAKKNRCGGGEWVSWFSRHENLADFPSLRKAQRMMKFVIECRETTLASFLQMHSCAPYSEEVKEIALAISRFVNGHTKDIIALKHTGDPESYTPAEYVDAARGVLGAIDLDPASNEMAQETVRAATWYGKETDGLKQPWRGRVFLNPPYSHPEIAHFIDKLCASYTTGDVSAAILLTNDNTDTKWWQLAAATADAICFPAGRINFYKADRSQTQPTNGQTFFYLGPEADRFAETFSTIGLIGKITLPKS